MSYILDALRKADAERDRGNVPGIHAQPSFGGAMPTRTQPAAKPWPWLAAGALAALLIGALVWYLTSPARVATGASASIATAPATPPVAAPTPPVVATPAKAVQPIETPRTRPEPTPVARKTKPAAPADNPNASGEAKATATAAAAAGEKVYAIAELPDDIRRQLPNVNVGGSMYSSKPVDRVLIINGQVLHEGDRIAPDLVLQQIRVKAALLNFKGYRYTLTF